jgi:transcriptional regulator with XRE-family HTH domain
MKVGENLLRIRQEKGLRRTSLVEKIRAIYGDNAVNYRTVERIERGDIDKGRLSTLLQIANALDVDIDQLYAGTLYEDRSTEEEKSEGLFITRSRSRGDLFRYNEKASLEIISPQDSGYICFVLKLGPNGSTNVEQDPEGTIKFLYITSGRITVSVGTVERTLFKGDFAQFDSHKMHHFDNRSTRAATALVYQTPKHY